MSTRPSLPMLRVLCLHDADSHARDMQEAWAALAQRLQERHSIELVFVNSPLALLGARASHNDPTAGDEPRRVWWHGDSQFDDGTDDDQESCPPSPTTTTPNYERHDPLDTSSSSDDDGSDTDASSPRLQRQEEEPRQPEDKKALVGLDASLLYLQQVWTSKPYWGLMGKGQGAAVASLFSLLPTTHPPPQCLVLCDASSALLQERDRLSSVPCLHVGPNPSEALVAQFGGHVVKTSSSSSSSVVKTSSSSSSSSMSDDEGNESSSPRGSMRRSVPHSILNAVGRFLVEQRRATLCDPDSTGGQIVALQAALHAAEADATDCIAREIAARPPKALMAIILPHHVGGWSGDRRRQPGEQGGGAPCPEEFLLHRDQRTAASDGASRHHPRSSDATT